MKRQYLFIALCATVLGFAPTFTLADIYRVVDENGNVTFTDQPPENSEAENIQQRIDEAVERNTAPSLETQRANDPNWVKEVRDERQKKAEEEKNARAKAYAEEREKWEKAMEQAKRELEQAKQARKDGKEIKEGDYVGNASGGARPSEEYLQRQEKLEQDVISAKNALKALKKSRPKR